MLRLRTASFLFLALVATGVYAEQITCESRGDRAEACSTVTPGSDIQLIQQISNSPCIEGSTWGVDDASVWVSNGCRAVFDVNPRYSSSEESYRYDPDVYELGDRHYYGSRVARDDGARNLAHNACIARAISDQPYGADRIGTSDMRRVSDDLFVVHLNTPKGPVSCTADRTGIVRSFDSF